MEVLPTNLDYHISDYSLGSPGGVIETEVGGGMPRGGLDWDRGVQPFQITMTLDLLQFQVWTYWFHNNIKKGALPFQMHLDSGMGWSPHTVRMIANSYNATRSNGALVVISFGVRAESQAYVDPAAGAALIDVYNVYGQETNNILAAIEQFAIVDSNVLDF